MIILVGIVGIVVGLLVGSKYASSKWSKAYDKMSDELISKCSDLTNKWGDSMKQSLELLGQVKDLTQQNIKLESELSDAKESLAEHEVIFKNLEQDPMCLATAVSASDDLYEVMTNNASVPCDVLLGFLGIDYRYDSISNNYYNSKTDEIVISLFDDYNDKQGQFLFGYLNEKFGTNLNGSDIRTRTLFTILHELGHYVDYTDKKESGDFESYKESYVEQKKALYDLEYGPEMWKAYRELPAESFADEFAVKFIMKHFPELC